MSATLIATIAGLVTAFCWGTSDWLAARSTKKLSPMGVNFTVQSVSLLIAAGLLLAYGLHLHTIEQLVRIGLSSVLITGAFLIFLRALSLGAVGIVVPLANIYPLFTVGLTILFLKADFSATQLGAMGGIVLGAALLAYEKNHQKIPLTRLHRQTMLAFLAAITWGFGFFVLNPVVDQVPWQTISIVSELFAFVFTFIIVALASGANFARDTGTALRSGAAYVVGLFGMAGMLSFYIGSTRAGSVVIPTVLAGTGPLIASLWGRLFDHERIGALKRVGAVVTVAGIIILNLS